MTKFNIKLQANAYKFNACLKFNKAYILSVVKKMIRGPWAVFNKDIVHKLLKEPTKLMLAS